MSYNLGNATGSIVITYDGRGVARARNELGQFVSQQEQANRRMADSGSTMQKAGLLIAAGIGSAVTVAAKFEKQLSAVKAVSGATSEEMEVLRQKALDIGKDTSFSAAEGAQAIEELVKAGVSVQDVMNGAADATVALAAAGEVALPDAAAIASNAMNQFGLAARDLPKVADNIAGAANASAIDVADFGYSLSQVGAVANLAGANFEDTATAIAIMGNAGIKGSDAGTSLKSVLMNLQPDTKKTADEMERLGLLTEDGSSKFYDAQGNLKGLGDIADLLQEKLKGMSKAQQQATLQTLFGADGIRAAAILAEGGAEGFDKMAKAMGKVTAADVAATRLDNFSGSLEALKGSLETLLIQVGTPLLGMFKSIVDAVTEVLDVFLSLDPKVQEAIVTFVAVAGVLLLVVGTFLKLRAAIIAGTALFGGMSLPILAVIAAIAALVAAFVYFYKTNDEFRAKVQEIATAVKKFIIDSFNAALPYIKQFGEFLVEKFQQALPYIQKLGPVLEAVGAFIVSAFKTALPYVKQFIGVMIDFAKFFAANVLPVVKEVGDQIIDSLVNAFESVIPYIPPVIDGIKDFVGSLVELFQAITGSAAFKFIVDMLQIIGNLLVTTIIPLLVRVGGVFAKVFIDTVGNVLRTALGIIRGVLRIITGVIKVFTGLLKGDFGKAWEGVKDIFKGAAQVLLSIVKGMASGLKTAISGIKDLLVAGVKAIPGALRGLGDLFKRAGKFIIDQFVEGIKNAAGLISGIAGNVFDFLKGLLNGAIDKINRALEFRIDKGPVNVSINPPDIPHLADGGIATRATLGVFGEAGPEAITPLRWLEEQIRRVYLAGLNTAQDLAMASGGPVSVAAGSVQSGSSRMVSGTLDISPSGRAFIRGMAEDVVDDEAEYSAREDRRYR